MKQETGQNNAHKPFDAWRVPIERIPKAGFTVRQELSKEIVAALAYEERPLFWCANAPGSVHIHLIKEAGVVRMTGDGAFTMAHPCVRCLNTVEVSLNLVFDLSLLPMSEDDDGSKALIFDSFDEGEGDDIPAHYFKGGEIDLLNVVREQLFIELPSYPVCEQAHNQECGAQIADAMQQKGSLWSASEKAKLVALKEVINRR